MFELKCKTAKSIYFATIDFILLLPITTRTKYLTLPAIPLKVSYYFSKLPNLKLKVLFSVRKPAGSSSLAREWNSVQRFLSLYIYRYPMSITLIPRCSYFFVSLSYILIYPVRSSNPVKTGNLIFSPLGPLTL